MGTMRNYIIRRIIYSFFTLLIISIFIFFLARQTPGSPLDYYFYLNPFHNIDPVFTEIMMKRMGLDKPVYVQYLIWLKGFLVGDLGWSFTTGAKVSTMISSRLPHTIILAICANIFALLIAVPLGVISALKQYTIIDNITMMFCLFGISVPTFWFALVSMYFFALRYNFLPVAGTRTIGIIYQNIFHESWDIIRHLILPVISLSITQLATIVRLTRSNLLEVLNVDYILTARAKGLPERIVILKHALRNALLPVVTVAGMRVSFMLAGSVFVESVFARAGIGRLLMYSIQARDYPLIMGAAMMIATVVVIGNLITDVVYVMLDPRIKYE